MKKYMKYETVIGLETHVELETQSKIFCSCGGHSSQIEPNDCVCPACCGMPGMLPVTNKSAIELAVRAGLMLQCHINQYTAFDKKSYYYPDLPCAYQVTQWFHPICVNGKVEVETKNRTCVIGIKQIHLEEDAGKLVHDEWSDTSLIDFNRTSVPLIEIVSRPDFRSAEEVISYLDTLKSMLRFAGISECEEGAMRCDVNISIRPEGSNELGVRTEIKNMNSLSSIERAVKYETARHMDALERGTEVLIQETRRWDDVKGKTFAMRNKETAADYRYFPDPNIMPVVIDDRWLAGIAGSMPEPAAKKALRYGEMGVSHKDVEILTSERALCDLFDALISRGCRQQDAVSWILTECAGILRKNGQLIGDLEISDSKLARIIELVGKNEITRSAGKRVLAAVMENDSDPDQFVKDNKLDSQTDESHIRSVVIRVLDSDPDTVRDYLGGKTKAFQSLFGGCMRELKGNGDPAVIKVQLESELSKRQTSGS